MNFASLLPGQLVPSAILLSSLLRLRRLLSQQLGAHRTMPEKKKFSDKVNGFFPHLMSTAGARARDGSVVIRALRVRHAVEAPFMCRAKLFALHHPPRPQPPVFVALSEIPSQPVSCPHRAKSLCLSTHVTSHRTQSSSHILCILHFRSSTRKKHSKHREISRFARLLMGIRTANSMCADDDGVEDG
jgi:hypothetical protein